MNKLPDRFKKTAIFLFWLTLWLLASRLVHNRILLVGPLETLKTLADLFLTLPFWKAVGFSFCRISLGFFLAFFAGILTGALSCWKNVIGEFLAPPIQLMKSIPVASFVILALIWIGSRNLSVFIAFLVVYPIIHINTVSGLKSADPMLLEMAGVFRVPLHRKAICIYRIFLGPYLVSACKTALGMAFKSGIAAEVIGVPDGSIGEGLYQAKLYLSTAELFAWTLTIIIISAVFEKIFLFFLQKLTGKEHIDQNVQK